MDGIPKDLELRIKGHLWEIQQANDDVLGHRQGFPPAISAYEQTLESVATCATGEEVDQVAAQIKSYIHEKGERRRNREVRRTARQIVSQAGYPADRFLNAA